MKKVLFIVSLIIIIINSCSEGITEPQPGRRDYVWSVDTLNMPMNVVSSIWGSSGKDVWVVGGGGSADDRLWHYNGEEWKPYTKEIIFCTGETLYGFGKYNVWMGGGDGRIWHYDGAWKENFRYIVEGAWDVRITDIWGWAYNDIYACGVIVFYNMGETISRFQGFLLHYDGSKWEELVRGKMNTQFLSVRKGKEGTFIFELRLDFNAGNDTIVFNQLINGKLSEIYLNTEDNIVWGNINIIEGRVYFLIGRDAYRFINNKFEKQFSLLHPNFGYQFYGRNTKDIFVRMKDGLAHYNGTDIKYLFIFPIYSISIMNEPILFEDEVFFIMWEPANARNMVLHGILKQEKEE